MGKEGRCAVFGCNNDVFFSREIYCERPYLDGFMTDRAHAPLASHNTP